MKKYSRPNRVKRPVSLYWCGFRTFRTKFPKTLFPLYTTSFGENGPDGPNRPESFIDEGSRGRTFRTFRTKFRFDC